MNLLPICFSEYIASSRVFYGVGRRLTLVPLDAKLRGPLQSGLT
jgi:hypothetical protein